MLLLGVMLLPQLSFAYGAEAHAIIGHVAERFLCADTRDALLDIDPDYSLAEAGVWADRIRGNADWDIARPWHYINVPDGMDPMQVERPAKGDVLSAIELQQEDLEYGLNLARAERQALRFLIHFIADVHQPLHVGRQEDLGGNTVKVRSAQTRRTSNLHRYWDSDVLANVADPRAYAAGLLARAEPELAGWQPGELADWARESAEFRPLVYEFVPAETGGPVMLDAEYQRRALQIADQRLALAGLRLASELDSLYCSND